MISCVTASEISILHFRISFAECVWTWKLLVLPMVTLQHGNIMVNDGELYLVDYDGMFVPSMAGSSSNELGHRNYQHPRRSAETFGPHLDNFSAWVIYISLQAMVKDEWIYERLGSGDDCLLCFAAVILSIP